MSAYIGPMMKGTNRFRGMDVVNSESAIDRISPGRFVHPDTGMPAPGAPSSAAGPRCRHSAEGACEAPDTHTRTV